VGYERASRPLWRENLLYEEETGGGIKAAGHHRLEVGLRRPVQRGLFYRIELDCDDGVKRLSGKP
jgi:hypothetical protein